MDWKRFLFGDDEYIGLIFDVLSFSLKVVAILVFGSALFMEYLDDMPAICHSLSTGQY